LIPIGIYLGKRRLQKALVLQEPDRKTVIRRLAWFFGVTTILNIYDRNVFPELSVKWGTYPNSLCHTDFPVASDATTVLTQKREGGRSACHELVAMVDASPKILKTLGLEERISRVQKK